MAVDYKKKIGFTGTFLIEPKPQEPTKHQYDFDVATVHGFLQRYGLENEVKVNIETNHATLAGHTLRARDRARERARHLRLDRHEPRRLPIGWDTDQFPNNVLDMALAYYQILARRRLHDGGTNFDAKLRRQSLEPDDLLIAHIGAMDCCARALLVAAKMLEDGALETPLRERYAAWDSRGRKAILAGERRSRRSSGACVGEASIPSRAPASRSISRTSVNSYLLGENTWEEHQGPRRSFSRSSRATRRRSTPGTRSRAGPPTAATRACRCRAGTGGCSISRRPPHRRPTATRSRASRARDGIEITELSTHLQGQLVAVHPAYDEAFDAFAAPAVRGNPKARTDMGRRSGEEGR